MACLEPWLLFYKMEVYGLSDHYKQVGPGNLNIFYSEIWHTTCNFWARFLNSPVFWKVESKWHIAGDLLLLQLHEYLMNLYFSFFLSNGSRRTNAYIKSPKSAGNSTWPSDNHCVVAFFVKTCNPLNLDKDIKPFGTVKRQHLQPHKNSFIVSLKTCLKQVFWRCFRDPIQVPRIENGVPRIRENYHWVPRIREIRSLNIHIRYLTFSLKKPV